MARLKTLYKCTVPGCDGDYIGKGFCRYHYDRARKDDPDQLKRLREYHKKWFEGKKKGSPDEI
ncbi:hypothetical protein SB5439_05115 [Klebsiella variicola]|uniref:hypothetical protein n=1 Tax=Klebsiella variicola TaxID=244366 RepID=UPI0010CE8CEC|nr:hypothetical protein [Klebsiella variicola]VGQ12914.1 hypothetical protein SB5439_05115 [Klebsiella variicola]